MTDKGMSPDGRCEVVLVTEPEVALRCSWCEGPLTDDDADCPTCTTPLDWGASRAALQAWQASGAA